MLENIINNLLTQLSNIWWIFPIIAILLFIKTPIGKGMMGELFVNIILSFLNKKEYILLKNITIGDDSDTTQIDHIILSVYGIFIIETKNYSGWIYGSEKSKVWTQKFYKKKYKFQNPLHQNYKHVKEIEKILNIKDNIYSIVVFAGNATFKTTMPDNVIQTPQLLQHIKNFRKKVFTEEKVFKMKEKIKNSALPKNWKTHKKHVSNLKKRY